MGSRAPLQGTRIRFVPDRSLFERTRLSVLGLSWRMEELAALHAGVTFQLNDDMRHHEERHCFERGLLDYCARLSTPALPLHAPWSFEGHVGTTRVRLCLQWCRMPGRRVMSWVNQFHASGGTHLRGLSEGIGGALHHYTEVAQRTSEFSAVGVAPLLEGLTVLLDVTVAQPVWRGPVKGTLGDEECGDDVARLVQAWLGERFEAEPGVAAQVLDHAIGRSIARG
jgi:DNA gyrase/topoisomerase IV subunit B